MRRVSLLLPILAGCAGASWRAVTVFQAPDKLGGCAIGDADPSRPGNEIVSVCRTGEVFLTWREGEGWRSEPIARLPGEAIQVGIGDADPALPGEEIVAVGVVEGGEDDGGRGAATLIFRQGAQWKVERIFEDQALLHAVCFVPGGVFVGGYSLKGHLLKKGEAGWEARLLAALPGAAKNAIAASGGIVVACKDGSLVRIERESGKSSLIHRHEAGRSRLGGMAEQIIVANDDGTLHLVIATEASVIYREANKLRGAVLEDLDPDRPGLEAATAGYEKKLSILYRNNGWEAVEVYRDTDRFHHLASGRLPGVPGIALAACGYSGRLVVAFRSR